MGCDATATLIYGFKFSPSSSDDDDFDPDEKDWNDDEEERDFYALVSDFLEMKQPLGQCPFFHEDQEGWRRYRAASDERSDTYPIDHAYSGSDGEMSTYVGILIAKRDWGQEEPIELFLPNLKHVALLKEFCEFAKIEWQEPQYYLLASYF